MRWILIIILSTNLLFFSGCTPIREIEKITEKLKGSSEELDYDQIYDFYDEKKYQEADEMITKYLEKHPDDFDALSEKTHALIMLDKNEEAILLIDKLLHKEPMDEYLLNNKSWAYNNLGAYELGLKAAEEALSIGEADEYEFIQKADALYGLERYEEALEYYTLAINKNSTLYYAYYGRGLCLTENEDYENALYSYKRSYEGNPRGSYYGIIDCLKTLERHEEIVKEAAKMIEKYPGYSDAYFDMAEAYKSLGDVDKALKYYDKAIESSTYNSHAWYEKYLLYLQLKDKKNAYQCIKKVLGEEPERLYYIDIEQLFDELYEADENLSE